MPSSTRSASQPAPRNSARSSSRWASALNRAAAGDNDRNDSIARVVPWRSGRSVTVRPPPAAYHRHQSSSDSSRGIVK